MNSDREEICIAPDLPAGMAEDLHGYSWARDLIGESEGSVYRLHGKPGAPMLYLKHGHDAVADAIVDEMVRLRWLAKYISVPTIRYFTYAKEEAWLLMTALPGATAYQVLEARQTDRLAIVDALAGFLRRIHAIPVSECPFNSDHTFRLGLARQRIDAGLVDEGDFDAEREGWTAQQVWQSLVERQPLASDPVVTHGDFSLDNLLICDGVVAGCIDTGRAGIADRYQDLAIVWNCLGEFGSALQDRLLMTYGLTEVDDSKLQFHLMLDELF
jgi:aminoglycoside 3'-phosphotransferase I